MPIVAKPIAATGAPSSSGAHRAKPIAVMPIVAQPIAALGTPCSSRAHRAKPIAVMPIVAQPIVAKRSHHRSKSHSRLKADTAAAPAAAATSHRRVAADTAVGSHSRSTDSHLAHTAEGQARSYQGSAAMSTSQGETFEWNAGACGTLGCTRRSFHEGMCTNQPESTREKKR